MIHAAHVSQHACIRMHKMSWALLEQGNFCHLVSSFVAPGHSWNTYTTSTRFEVDMVDGRVDSRQLRNAVKLLDGFVDIWHIHNEPNWLFRVVSEESKKPIIFDIHDWTSLRTTAAPHPGELDDEKLALEKAAAFIVPSKGYYAKLGNDRPKLLIYSMVPKNLFPEIDPEKKPGLVYEGGLMGKSQPTDINFSHRNWAQFMHKALPFLPEEWKIYAYTANDGEILDEYKHERIAISAPLVYPDLLRALSAHSVGLVGSPFECGDFIDSMPNKLFEYVSAGLPVVVVNAPESAKYAEENGLGVGIRDVSELPRALERLTENTIARDRWGYTMESQLPKLVAFYWEVIESCQPKVIRQIG